VVPLQVQLTYAAVPRFAAPPVATAPQLETQITGLLARSTAVSNPAGVQVITAANNDVTLRGTVKDIDEARLIEGLVRLTPGVRFITNELVPAKP
jgi:osmotically-inducible protein OsmY